MKATWMGRLLAGENMLKSAKDILASGDTREIVDFAIETNRIVQATTKNLQTVKAWLRTRASEEIAKNPSMTNVKFEGHLGVAQVVVPSKPVVRARKGLDLQDLRRVLTDETYRSLCVERVVVDLTDDFEARFADLSPSERVVVERYVDQSPQTPRVNLPE